MDKIIDIKKLIVKVDQDSTQEVEQKPAAPKQKATNPIFKKLAQFSNEKLSQKFDINDLLR